MHCLNPSCAFLVTAWFTSCSEDYPPFVLHALNPHVLELFCGSFTCIMRFMGLWVYSYSTVIFFKQFLFVSPISCNSKLKFWSYYTLSLREDVIISRHILGQGLSLILGIWAKHITCITLMLILVNVWLVKGYSCINTLLRAQCNTGCPIRSH